MSRTALRLAARLGFVGFSLVLSALAFLRGNQLLGPGAGVAYLAITAGVLWILARSLALATTPSLLRAAVIAALAIPVGLAMGYPASINPDVQIFIDMQTTDRAARAELAAVFASDPAFAGLAASTVHLKAVNVTIRGSLPNRANLTRLRDRINRECPTLKQCPLHWQVVLREPGERVEGLDHELFRPARPGG